MFKKYDIISMYINGVFVFRENGSYSPDSSTLPHKYTGSRQEVIFIYLNKYFEIKEHTWVGPESL